MDHPAPRRTALYAVHEQAGAAFTDFGGWLMPVRYSSDLAEHHAVRTAAGLFDISHMGEITVTGPDAAAMLDHALAGAISAVPVGRAKYTMILDADGGILDDLIVYRRAEDDLLVIANAGNRDVVAAALTERAAGTEAIVADISDDTALVALQGPRAADILAATAGVTDLGLPLDQLGNYAFTSARFDGEQILVARTGYTGEDGFELLVPASRGAALWTALIAAGEPYGLVPAGLAARDTLRLEAGMPLYGHELGRDIRPAQVGLGRVIPAGKSGYVGAAGVTPPDGARVLVGLASEGRRAGRAGYGVFRAERRVGEITSGALSPTLGHPIAMAFLDPECVEADDLEIDIRGTRIPTTITTMPFYRRTR